MKISGNKCSEYMIEMWSADLYAMTWRDGDVNNQDVKQTGNVVAAMNEIWWSIMSTRGTLTTAKNPRSYSRAHVF